LNSYKLSELNVRSTRADLDANYIKANRDLYFLDKTYRLQLLKAEQSAENLRIAEEKYRLGLISLLDLDQAQFDNLSAQIAVNSTHYNLLKQEQAIHLLLSQPILGQW
jgi:outer membrane protein TolC